jgi:hypothetical protein
VTEQTDTPPVAGEIPEAALDQAAAAVVNYTLGAEVYDTFVDFQRAHWRKAMAAALPPLTAERDAETAALRTELAELREDHERNRQRLFELGPIIDALTHGGVADELASLREEAPRLRAELATSRRSEEVERGNCKVNEDNLIAVVEALGMDPLAVLLEDVIERAETLAEWGKTAKAIFGPDTAPAAVLADPAPSTPAAQEA